MYRDHSLSLFCLLYINKPLSSLQSHVCLTLYVHCPQLAPVQPESACCAGNQNRSNFITLDARKKLDFFSRVIHPLDKSCVLNIKALAKPNEKGKLTQVKNLYRHATSPCLSIASFSPFRHLSTSKRKKAQVNSY